MERSNLEEKTDKRIAAYLSHQQKYYSSVNLGLEWLLARAEGYYRERAERDASATVVDLTPEEYVCMIERIRRQLFPVTLDKPNPIQSEVTSPSENPLPQKRKR